MKDILRHTRIKGFYCLQALIKRAIFKMFFHKKKSELRRKSWHTRVVRTETDKNRLINLTVDGRKLTLLFRNVNENHLNKIL